ncbi:cullin-like protein, partial [Trifolium medium]|nr:cullin-like protein [Trifolium medium]
MASSSSVPETSSSVRVDNPLNPLDLPPIATLGKSLIVTGDVMNFNFCTLKIHPERMVDFESLKANDFDIEDLFIKQGWKRYFKMLNGPIYSRLVKEFWMKAQV